jgi:hypothetical protein
MLFAEDGQAYFLVEVGKRSAHERIAGLAGRHVELAGWLLPRADRRMIELTPEDTALTMLTEARPGISPGLEFAEAVTIRGEIVDTKCYLGAMKPGDGKAHKACATLCIEGGIPPMLVSFDSRGRRSYHVLTDADGLAATSLVLEYVGEPVEIEGRRGRLGSLPVLTVTAVRRVP